MFDVLEDKLEETEKSLNMVEVPEEFIFDLISDWVELREYDCSYWREIENSFSTLMDKNNVPENLRNKFISCANREYNYLVGK